MKVRPNAALRKLAILSALAVATPPAAFAESFCVGTAAELESALETAESNGENDVIKLRTGTYNIPSNGLDFESSEGKSLSLIGGHISFLGGCPRIWDDPTLTVIDAPTPAEAIELVDSSPSATGTPVYRVEGLTFQDGFAGLYFDNGASSVDTRFELVGNVFRRVRWYPFWFVARGTVQVWNNLVVDNGTLESPLNSEGARIHLLNAAATAQVTHNTFARNVPPADGEALIVTCAGAAAVDITNNIMVQTLAGDGDLELDAACDVTLGFNTIADVTGTADAGCCNSDANPRFVDPPAGDYRLRYDSPARNVGDLTPEGGLPPTDIVGAARAIGLPDLGAFEVPWVFASDFEEGSDDWSDNGH